MPCGRELPDGIAEQFLQLHCCLQQLADTIQSGRADESALVGHAVFRLARVMTGEAERASNL